MFTVSQVLMVQHCCGAPGRVFLFVYFWGEGEREGPDLRVQGQWRGTEPRSHTSTDTLAFSRLLGMLLAALRLPV